MRGIVKQVTKAVGLYEPLVRARDRKRPWHEGLSPEHLEEMQAFYARFVSRGSLVFDIGANVGNRTGVFRQLGARVIAVEPQPHCLNRLRGSFGHDPEVTLEAVALGPELGQALSGLGRLHGRGMKDRHVSVDGLRLDRGGDRSKAPAFATIGLGPHLEDLETSVFGEGPKARHGEGRTPHKHHPQALHRVGRLPEPARSEQPVCVLAISAPSREVGRPEGSISGGGSTTRRRRVPARLRPHLRCVGA
ncbi:MAG: FkbM family methyltransferase [Planctomycetota bacterium]